eukprot:CAMPEP_0170562460 /NCGR_PEP_ID=MMETSP0211-20121228/60640_1 /TAXON_ID=311385 /ORGANISM="Pseudokeronopsis sp., Strain OXSARD2" /LENGTH=95 /DNA_ID=CAMNT_0010879363 /DNA_START=837 /DNA_END=1124 /DNA_ORIENTATION=-
MNIEVIEVVACQRNELKAEALEKDVTTVLVEAVRNVLVALVESSQPLLEEGHHCLKDLHIQWELEVVVWDSGQVALKVVQEEQHLPEFGKDVLQG